MTYLEFLRANRRWLAGGFLLTLSSSFGQTFFISLFGGDIRGEFSLSHGDFGTLYAIATLASAFVIIWLGKLADHMRIAPLSIATIAGLAAACAGMGAVQSTWMLVLVLFGLRLFGQGMLSHIPLTAMGRWFSAQRGRAVAIATLGFAFGEAVSPILAVSLSASIGWRQAWFVSAVVLLVLFAPVIWGLFSVRRVKSGAPIQLTGTGEGDPQHSWTRTQMLKDPLFYALLPGLLTPAFIITGVFFHQVHLVESKGWSLGLFAGAYPLFAGISVLTGLGTGFAIDRWSASSLLPYYLLPLAGGLMVLAGFDGSWTGYCFMALAGFTVGISATILGAIWADVYGTAHLGAIRALGASLMAFSTALSPGTMGWLIDAKVILETQFFWMAVYIFVVSACSLLLARALHLRQMAPLRA
ncbi:MAG: MFS transporter [Hyphomicrobiales bacterium]